MQARPSLQDTAILENNNVFDEALTSKEPSLLLPARRTVPQIPRLQSCSLSPHPTNLSVGNAPRQKQGRAKGRLGHNKSPPSPNSGPIISPKIYSQVARL